MMWQSRIASFILLVCLTPIASEHGGECSLHSVLTSLKYLRKSVDQTFDILSKKLEWTTSTGHPPPNNITSLLKDMKEVLTSLKEVHRSMSTTPVQGNSARKITIRVNSEGCCGRKEDSGIAPLYESPIFYLNEEKASDVNGRGFNFMTVSRATGRILQVQNFDTWGSSTSQTRMWEFVRNIPDDTIVAVSVVDDGSHYCRADCRKAIAEVGGTEILGYRDGYALIGYKGTYCGSSPPWRKEMKRSSSGYGGEQWESEEYRSGQGPLPISLISVIDLDHCY